MRKKKLLDDFIVYAIKRVCIVDDAQRGKHCRPMIMISDLPARAMAPMRPISFGMNLPVLLAEMSSMALSLY